MVKVPGTPYNRGRALKKKGERKAALKQAPPPQAIHKPSSADKLPPPDLMNGRVTDGVARNIYEKVTKFCLGTRMTNTAARKALRNLCVYMASVCHQPFDKSSQCARLCDLPLIAAGMRDAIEDGDWRAFTEHLSEAASYRQIVYDEEGAKVVYFNPVEGL